MSDDEVERDYKFPLGEHHRDEISTITGVPVSDLSIERVQSGVVAPGDVSISAETLVLQADFARAAGFDQVAANLERAAEMTRIPNVELLDIYEALRPGRSTYYKLLSLSQRINSMYDAELTGEYIREAADVYRDTGLLKMDEE